MPDVPQSPFGATAAAAALSEARLCCATVSCQSRQQHLHAQLSAFSIETTASVGIEAHTPPGAEFADVHCAERCADPVMTKVASTSRAKQQLHALRAQLQATKAVMLVQRTEDQMAWESKLRAMKVAISVLRFGVQASFHGPASPLTLMATGLRTFMFLVFRDRIIMWCPRCKRR